MYHFNKKQVGQCAEMCQYVQWAAKCQEIIRHVSEKHAFVYFLCTIALLQATGSRAGEQNISFLLLCYKGEIVGLFLRFNA